MIFAFGKANLMCSEIVGYAFFKQKIFETNFNIIIIITNKYFKKAFFFIINNLLVEIISKVFNYGKIIIKISI